MWAPGDACAGRADGAQGEHRCGSIVMGGTDGVAKEVDRS